MSREGLIEVVFSNLQKLHRCGSANFHTLLGQQDISPSQMELLIAVKRSQPVSVKAIAEQMRLTPGAVTQLMEGLVAKRYIERQPDAHDHRITNVRLAEDGAQQLEQLWTRRTAMLRDIVKTLDTDELTIMLRVQEKMLHYFEACTAANKTQV